MILWLGDAIHGHFVPLNSFLGSKSNKFKKLNGNRFNKEGMFDEILRCHLFELNVFDFGNSSR